MGRAPCCSKVGLHRGPWTAREDALLTKHIQCHGEGNWRSLPKKAGLLRCGKSCRLRWMNYLRPDIKRGNIGPDEEDLIIRLHSLLGNRWSLIAGRLPGRTDNEIKNYWNSHLSKKLKKQGLAVREGTSRSPSAKRSKTSGQKKGNKTSTTAQDKMTKKKKIEAVADRDGDQTTPIRTEIHTPKPTRFTPSTNLTTNSYSAAEVSEGSADLKIASTSSDQDQDHTGVENLDISWPTDPNLVLDFDFSFQDNLLETVYQEYSQLLSSSGEHHLPLVSFTESLLV